jgi:cytochrome o ubiquinol oxidase subunit 2
LFSVRYRESNKKHVSYTPDWDSSRKIETLWWLFPTILIAILSVITWRSTEKLTPSRPIASSNPTMLIQVVALDWKWLFLYPDQHIATVNSVTIPKNTPVDFVITADAPMNSFWIPQLGGQIYAMAGMTTQLNLLASQTGNFRGLSANISGDGFSSMDFMAHAKTQQSFDAWVRSAQQNQTDLTMASYNHLVKPSEHVAPFQFGSFTPGLFDTVIMKYMAPTESGSSMRGMSM